MEESLFLNYAMAPRFRDVPKGMIPMCYPSDVTLAEPHWIPNFGLCSVIELDDCIRRGGSRRVAAAFRPKAGGLLRWFRKYRDADGLLADLPGWIFVEWSAAANSVNGVSYITNMTYARFLEAMGGLYALEDCREEAEKVRETVRRRSKRGLWFRDCSKSDVCSEACQYYAFYTGTATREKDGGLWETLIEKLGPMRREGVLPQIIKSDLLFGYSLRFVLLSEAGLSGRVLEEVKACYGPMAEKTGTLWEGMDVSGDHSCCHGFPSLAAWLIAREALGVRRIDHAAKTVDIRIPARSPLPRCEGTLPLADGRLAVSWRREGEAIDVDIACPEGWTINRTEEKR
jgi:alpha-L-rhamnosidase